MDIQEIGQVSYEELLQQDYREYARYAVFHRAIPSLTDGFKPTARKAIYVAQHRAKSLIKVSSLSGYVAAEAHYDHGEVSLQGTIIKLAQKFKQSLPYFHGEGNFGTIHAQAHAAPRYVKVKMSDNFDKMFKDSELLTPQYTEGVEIEPLTYLPIIPTVLLNAVDGLTLGYSSTIMNRNPVELCEAVIEYLKNSFVSDAELTPYVYGLAGHWQWVHDKFEHHGKIEYDDNRRTINITAIPYTWSYEAYEQHLQSLVEEDYAKDWVNNTDEGRIHYIVEFDKDQYARIKAEDSAYHKLKMYARVPKDNLTMIAPDGTINRYETVADVIKTFVNWRLPFYDTRKELLISKKNEELTWNEQKLKFIKLVIAKEILVENFKSRKEATSTVNSFDLPEKVLDIKIYSISHDMVTKLERLIRDNKRELKELTKLVPLDMYIEDVTELRTYMIETLDIQAEYVA